MQLTVGYHRLEGKLVALRKPLAILRKTGSEGSSSFEVVGVARSKWLFKTRPLALISAPEASGKRAKTTQNTLWKTAATS